MADAGLRLVVEGEKEFKAALGEIDTAVKNNQKSLKLLSEEYKLNAEGMKDAESGFGSMAEAAAILADKGKVLADSIAMQSEKVELLDLRVQEAAEAYGEHDKRTEALKAQLLDASAALAKMTTEQEKNRQAMLDAQNSTKEYDDAVGALEASLSANEAEMKALRAEVGTLGGEYGKLGNSADDLNKKTENLRRQNEALDKQNKVLADSITKEREAADKMNAAMELAVKRYGEGSKEAEAYRKKIAEASGQIDKMESELKENAAAIEQNNAKIAAGGDAPNPMLEGLKKISDMTGIQIPAGIETMIGGFSGGAVAVGGIVAALGSVASKMKEIYKESIYWAQDITTASQELDLSTEEYQELSYIATATGADIGALTTALSRVSAKAGEAAYKQETLKYQMEALREEMEKAQESREYWSGRYVESGYDEAFASQVQLATQRYEEAKIALDELKAEADEATGYFDELGISIYDQNGELKDAKDLLYEVIDAYAGTENEIIRSYEMTQLLGKSYARLKPYLSDGSAGLRDMADEARAAGIIIEDELVAAMNDASIAADKFNAKMEAIDKKFFGNPNSGSDDALYWLVDKVSAFFSGIFGQKYASGTNYAPGGLALVGERGPEIVDLPRGSKVYPHGVIPSGLGGTAVYETNTYNISIDASRVEEFNDIVRIAQGARVGMRRG